MAGGASKPRRKRKTNGKDSDYRCKRAITEKEFGRLKPRRSGPKRAAAKQAEDILCGYDTLAQIPISTFQKQEKSIDSSRKTPIDLTLDDDCDDANISSSCDKALTPSWQIGQIVQTPFGIGSVQRLHSRRYAISNVDNLTSTKANGTDLSPGKEDANAATNVTNTLDNGYSRETPETIVAVVHSYASFQKAFTLHYHDGIGLYVKLNHGNGQSSSTARLAAESSSEGFQVRDFDRLQKVNQHFVHEWTVDEAYKNLSKETSIRLELHRYSDEQTGRDFFLLDGQATKKPTVSQPPSKTSAMIEIYEVWLRWGDGCYFQEFSKEHEESEGGKRKKRKRKDQTFEKAWMPKAFLNGDELSAVSSLLFSFCYSKDRSKSIVVPASATHRKCTESPSKGQWKSIDISEIDNARLWPGVYLNDTLLDFYMAYITCNSVSSKIMSHGHVFGSLFFSLMPRRRACSKWTKDIDIFKKDFIIIPINIDMHWCLAIVCNPGKLGEKVKGVYSSIVSKESLKMDKERSKPGKETGNVNVSGAMHVLFLDSMKNNRTKPVMSRIRNYLAEEWECKYGKLSGPVNGKVLPAASPIVPEQRNGCDCGVFILEFMERLLTADFEKFSKVLRTESVTEARSEFNKLFGRKWFTQVDVAKKRHQIACLVRDLSTSQT